MQKMTPPMISVIVPTFNAASTIDACLASISRQGWRQFEVVICDGASSDDTVALALRWQSELLHLRVDSRKDDGVYDAINRGIGLSTGRWILVLGADDQLAADDTLARAADALSGAKVRFVYGDVRMGGANPWVDVSERYPGPMTASRLFSQNICQQSVFYRRDLFETHGGFQTHYRVCADWDMALRVFASEPTCWIDEVVADYAATGLSSRVPDLAFRHDRPLLVARLVARQPFNDRFVGARYALATHAREASRSGRRRDAASLWAAAYWLTALGVLRRLFRRGGVAAGGPPA